MNKRKGIIWIIIIIVAVLVIYSIPRITFCCIYHNIVSKPLALETLSIKPRKIVLPEPNQSCVFSLGFADIPLCHNSINSISYRPEYGLICRTDSNCLTYFFLLPDSPLEVNTITKYSICDIKDYYDLQVKAANAMPVKYSEIVFSDPCVMVPYIVPFALFKVNNHLNQKGIGLFESEDIKGLIRFGTKNNPCSIQAEIFSKDGNITQCITILSDSPAKSSEALLALLSSYRFTISQVKDSNFLDELIINQLSGNSKFEMEK